jgi:hypothetical protein
MEINDESTVIGCKYLGRSTKKLPASRGSKKLRTKPELILSYTQKLKKLILTYNNN